RLQVHDDNGCLRSHQVAQVDRSNRLNDSRLPKQATAAHFKLVDNAQARIRRYLGYIFSSLLGEQWADGTQPQNHPLIYTDAEVDACIARIGRGETSIYSDTDKLLWVALGRYPIMGKSVAVMGSISPVVRGDVYPFRRATNDNRLQSDHFQKLAIGGDHR